ncbi:AAA family ATPase [Tumidithrix elongata RA019]|uniref:AAA family ATPase n=1 Tax=Tumidithrix elongata BACA0141 TaxID=2716417 RepID=A0AAW9PUQ1_9CYAN|nr:AAA family ATPase [Tumidithrix elongata RA019]
MTEYDFEPDCCRNESEVESKLIVQYLLPQLGYEPDTWHQEITFGRIRLDFLAIASKTIPFAFNRPLSVGLIVEAKHPKQNLNNHIRRMRRYLKSLNVQYGLLTNGKEVRIFELINQDLQLIFQCSGKEIKTKIDEIQTIIGKDRILQKRLEAVSLNQSDLKIIESEYSGIPAIKIDKPRRANQVKTIAVYHNKGGVGKTTTVINLAAALSKRGFKVLIIDIDSQANTTFATGLMKFTDEDDDDLKDSNIYHVIMSNSKNFIPDVARKTQFTDPEVDTVPSHISLIWKERELADRDISRRKLIDKLRQVQADYDYVLIDTPPSLNIYAKIALYTADYLIIPSDLKPFANEGLRNVKTFIEEVDEFREGILKQPLKVLGVLPSKILTTASYVKNSLPKAEKLIETRYGFPVLETRIFQREDLAKCIGHL